MEEFLMRAGAVLRINVGAVVANWRSLTEKVRPHARVAAVVKADSYGLGASRLVPALAAAGCGRFVVATLDEALELRPLAPGAEFLVLSGPLPGTEADFAGNGVIPVLNSTGQVAAWAALAALRGRPLPSAIHVDTGMSRLGLSAREAEALGADAATLAAIRPLLVMSHLACADEPENPMNGRQLERFNAARSHFPGVEGSLAASSGIFLGRDWFADWVRPGAALYGVNPRPKTPNPMTQVVRLQGKIIQVRDVDAGDTVGYGATYLCRDKGRMAVVAAGYADGLFRALGNRGCGYLEGRRVPLAGRVSMDLVTFDVTHVPEALVRPGAVIDLISEENTVDDVAGAAGTIGYEVLTALGRRYLRVYEDEGGGAP